MIVVHLERHAIEKPDAIALRWNQTGQVLTYGQLWTQASARAERLAGLNLHGSPLLIFGANDHDAIITFIAAMRCGLTPSFMPRPTARFDEKAFWNGHEALFKHIQRGLIIAPETDLAGIRRNCANVTLTLTASESLDTLPAALLPEMPAAATIALLQHSSGTTGLKKGVALSYEAIELQLQGYAEAVGFDGDSVIASWLPLYHDMGLIACLMLPLTFGAEVNVIDPFYWTAKPQTLFDVVEERRATHVWLPNFAFLHLDRAVRRTGRSWDLSSVRAWVNCSEPCKPFAFDAFLESYASHGVMQGALTCCYAMAETVFAVTQTPPGEPVRIINVASVGFGEPGTAVQFIADGSAAIAVLSCGPAIRGCTVRIQGAEEREAFYGQIQVAADFLFDGYFRDAERTAKVLQDGWYSTGDVGFIVDGELYVCGRLDDRIIVGGRNLYAHQIEQLVGAIPGVSPGRVVAFGVLNEHMGSEQLVVAAEINAGADEITRAVIETIDATLGLRPTDVRLFSDRRIIKTTSGKVDRRLNRERYLSGGFA